MLAEIWRNVRLAIVTFLIFGIAYSVIVLGIGQALFPRQANGSLVTRGGRVVGSMLIGQAVTSKDLFQDRPSATVNPQTGKPEPYAANNSGGSNLGPTNRALVQAVRSDIAAIRPLVGPGPIPANLVESSGSGLDPEITLQSALLQVPGLAKRTGISAGRLRALVLREVRGPSLDLYGPQRVNVLQLNLALRRLEAKR
ncbi:MAG: potassium-transporting ATPase subunit KdpC [Thermaerobacter sp.]|nr:potassium-transporting ATPase subunit KdpC [Thermaerobacter sp.]